jgi:hypothetical protein
MCPTLSWSGAERGRTGMDKHCVETVDGRTLAGLLKNPVEIHFQGELQPELGVWRWHLGCGVLLHQPTGLPLFALRASNARCSAAPPAPTPLPIVDF